MNKKNRETAIYIVLIHSLTGLGKLVSTFSSYPYTHIAVCMDHKLERFAAFSRKEHYAPFHAGFMYETRDCYAFGAHKSVRVKVFRLPVSTEHYKQIQAYIQRIEQDPEYIFNLFSMLTMPLLHGVPIYKAHNCMSFTARILSMSGTVKLKKAYYKYSIPEMDALLTNYCYKECLLTKKYEENPKYMQHIKPTEFAASFIRLCAALSYRVLCKRGITYE